MCNTYAIEFVQALFKLPDTVIGALLRKLSRRLDIDKI